MQRHCGQTFTLPLRACRAHSDTAPLSWKHMNTCITSIGRSLHRRYTWLAVGGTNAWPSNCVTHQKHRRIEHTLRTHYSLERVAYARQLFAQKTREKIMYWFRKEIVPFECECPVRTTNSSLVQSSGERNCCTPTLCYRFIVKWRCSSRYSRYAVGHATPLTPSSSSLASRIRCATRMCLHDNFCATKLQNGACKVIKYCSNPIEMRISERAHIACERFCRKYTSGCVDSSMFEWVGTDTPCEFDSIIYYLDSI